MLSSKVVERKMEAPGEVSGSLGILGPLHLRIPMKVSHGEDGTAVGQQGQQFRKRARYREENKGKVKHTG